MLKKSLELFSIERGYVFEAKQSIEIRYTRTVAACWQSFSFVSARVWITIWLYRRR